MTASRRRRELKHSTLHRMHDGPGQQCYATRVLLAMLYASAHMKLPDPSHRAGASGLARAKRS